MYRLNIVLIGDDESVMPHVRREVLNQWGVVDAQFADISSALSGVWLEADASRLFIVHVTNKSELAQLKRLGGTFVGRPIIAIVDPAKDASILVSAMRAGAAQVVPLPLQPEDFAAAMDCIAVQSGLKSTRARSFAVVGALGGCGTTSVAMNLAYEIAFLKHVHCILVELAVRFGVLANLLDVQPKRTISNLLADLDRLDSHLVREALTEIADNFFLLPGPYEEIAATSPTPDEVFRILSFTDPLAEAVVLDVPCTYDDLYFRALSEADKIVLVCEQKVSSIRGAQMVCETLGNIQPLIVINRYDPKMTGFTAERIGDLLRVPEVYSIGNDPSIAAAANSGWPLRLQAPHSMSLAQIDDLVELLLPSVGQQHDPVEKSSLLGRLGRVLSLS